VSTTLKFENIKFFLGCVNIGPFPEYESQTFLNSLQDLNLQTLSVQEFENIPVFTLKNFEITNDYIKGNKPFDVGFNRIVQRNCYNNLFLTPNQDLNNYNIIYIYSKTQNNLQNLIQFKINFFEIKKNLNYQSKSFKQENFEKKFEKVYKLQSVIYRENKKYYCIYKYKNQWYDSKGNNVADLNETKQLKLFAYSTNEKEIEIEKELETIPTNEEPAQVSTIEENVQIPINKEPAKIPCNDNHIEDIVNKIDINDILDNIDYIKNNDEDMVVQEFTTEFNNSINKIVNEYCKLIYDKNKNNFIFEYKQDNMQTILNKNLFNRGASIKGGEVEKETNYDQLTVDQITNIKNKIKEKIEDMVNNSKENVKAKMQKLKIYQENNKILEENIKKIEQAKISKDEKDIKEESDKLAKETETALAAALTKAAKEAAAKKAEEEAALTAAATTRPKMAASLISAISSKPTLKKTVVNPEPELVIPIDAIQQQLIDRKAIRAAQGNDSDDEEW
jgi:hypothetical protein